MNTMVLVLNRSSDQRFSENQAKTVVAKAAAAAKAATTTAGCAAGHCHRLR